MVDYTPSGAAVGAGDIVVLGAGVRIAHSDIADGVKGALSIGGGNYYFPKLAGSGVTLAVGTQAYWDVADAGCNGSASGNIFAGTVIVAAADGDAGVWVHHHQPATVGS